MVKYVVGFIVVFVLILFFGFIALNKTAPSAKSIDSSEEIQGESLENTPKMTPKHTLQKPKETVPNRQISFAPAKKPMVGGAEVEWVEPDTSIGEGEFGAPPE